MVSAHNDERHKGTTATANPKSVYKLSGLLLLCVYMSFIFILWIRAIMQFIRQ